jgi:hypothetical protein
MTMFGYNMLGFGAGVGRGPSTRMTNVTVVGIATGGNTTDGWTVISRAGDNDDSTDASTISDRCTVVKIGQNFGSGNEKVVDYVVCRGGSGLGFWNSSNPSMGFSLYGSNSGIGVSETLLGTSGTFTDTSDATERTIISSDTSTAWQYVYVWYTGTKGSYDARMSEFDVYGWDAGSVGVGFNFKFKGFDEVSDTTVYTYSDVDLGPADASRVILVQTSAGNLIPGSDVSGITVGGTAMTLGVRSTSSEGTATSGAYDTEIWYKDLSDGTSGDVVVTYGAARTWQHTAVVTLTGTATSPHATATDTAGDPLSINIAVEAGGIVFGAFTSNSNTSVTLSDNLTELYDEGSGNETNAGGAAIFESGATVTITGDFASAGSRKRGAAVSFSPLG